jgi:hypothetical protein
MNSMAEEQSSYLVPDHSINTRDQYTHPSASHVGSGCASAHIRRASSFPLKRF